MKVRFSLLLFLSLVFAAVYPWRAFAQAPAKPETIVFTNANVIDGVSAQALRGATVILRDGRIEKVQSGAAHIPLNVKVIDLKGKWLLPGWIDAHVHLFNLTSARNALRYGVTTARSMGVSHFVDIGMRQLNHAGAAELPDVVASGYHVRPKPAEEFFLQFPQMMDMRANGVRGAEYVRRMVRAQLDRGVDVIKIMATDRAGLVETDPLQRIYTEEELAAAVAEARSRGIFVAAHAHGDEGAEAAVRAGVRSIEHGTYLSEQTLALMKERGTYLVPTVATIWEMGDPSLEDTNPTLAIRARAMLPRIRLTAARAWKMGVKIVAATDTGYSPGNILTLPMEVVELVGIGMPPMEAIKAGTSVAAECLGIEKRTGAIRAGLEADLIVIERDPLTDISALHELLMVVNNGRIALNRLYGNAVP